MKNADKRNRVIEITCDIITRQGIRSARVDEIAHIAGISKRTLYELFEDKTELIFSCLERLSSWRREMLDRKFNGRNGNSLRAAAEFVREYTDALYLFECEFLADLKNRAEFAENYRRDCIFWKERMMQLLQRTIEDGYVPARTDVELIAETILSQGYDLRMAGRDRTSQRVIAGALLRGISTPAGVALFDDGGVM